MTADSKKTKELYDKLRECFISPDSNNADKAKRFRSLYEEFSYIINPNALTRALPLAARLAYGFKQYNVPNETRELSRHLLDRLNSIVHNDSAVSHEELKQIYKDMLVIARNVTNAQPDEASSILSGLSTDKWYTQRLNDEQKKAVLDNSRVIVVNAGPGTGKTYLLVWKMMQYLDEDWNRHVVALSFTTSAARQLGQKFASCLGEARKEGFIDEVRDISNVTTSTIHAYCLHCLMDFYAYQKKDFDYEIVDLSDVDELLTAYLEQHPDDSKFKVRSDLAAYITRGEKANPQVNIFMTENHYIRVDQILDLFITHSANNQEFTTWMAGKVDCLLVDEVQDLTTKIYKAIEAIIRANPKAYMFFVGDPRQNIYAFNGGSYNNLINFLKNQRIKPSTHSLTSTYRCPQAVIDRVNPLTFIDCKNPALVLRNESLTGNYQLIQAPTEYNEARKIVDIIVKLHDNKNTCVLASAAKHLELTAIQLNDHDIPFVMKRGGNELKPEVKLLNQYLKIVFGLRTNSLKTGNTKLLEKIKELQFALARKDNEISISDCIKQLTTVTDWGDRIYSAINLMKLYAAKAEEFKDLRSFMYACVLHKNEEGYAVFFEDGFNVECKTKPTEDNPPVTLSTIHFAKGREWDNVILAGANDNNMPRFSCTTAEEINEEKKKYYVAVTRCKQNLYITYPTTTTNQYGRIFNHNVSRFVTEGDKPTS